MGQYDHIHASTGDQLKEHLFRRPSWSEADRELSHAERVRKVSELNDFFEPTRFQHRYALTLFELMREREEQAREQEFYSEPVEICAELILGKRSYPAILPILHSDRRSAQGSLLLAMPGMGKTRTTRRVLRLFPQRTERIGQAPRIAWLYLKASPADHHAFCRKFLQELELTAADFRISPAFLEQNASKSLLPAAVVELAKVHSLGCLVLDNVQNMITTENAEVPKVRQLLKRLQEEAGVPVILLGTMAGAAYVEGELEAALAFGGSASDVWDRLPCDESWDEFVSALWPYQWTKTPVELSELLSERLYHHTQGIIGLALALYGRVQKELIQLGARAVEAGRAGGPADEIITADMIDAVAEWCFKPFHAHIDALRSRDFAKLSAIPDLKPFPSEARRLEAARKQLQEETEDLSEAEPITLEAEGLEDATDEQITEARERVTREADLLTQSAKLAMSAAEIGREEQETILAHATNEVGNKIYAEPRKFLASVERQIQKVERARNQDQKRERRVATAEDLDSILEPGSDLYAAIAASDLGLDALLATP